MRQSYISIVVIVLFIFTACEKAGKLQPNLVPLGYPLFTSVDPQSGKPGTLVHITGDNFSDVPAIIKLWVGDLPAQVKSHTMNDLYFTVPNSLVTVTGLISLEVNEKKSSSGLGFKILTPWSEKARYLGYNYSLFETFILNSKAYILEPFSPNYEVNRNYLRVYDPELNTWSDKADLPGGIRYYHTDFTIKNKAYAGLGYGAGSGPYGYFNDFWSYDPEANSWNKIANYPGETKSNAISFQAGGKGYVCGGRTYADLNSMELWEYDPELNVWTRKNDLTFVVQNAVEMSGIAYIADFEGNLYNYNSDQDTFQKIATNPYSNRFEMMALDGSVFFFAVNPVNNISEFNCTNLAWSIHYGPFPINVDYLIFNTDKMGFCIDFEKDGALYRFSPANFN